MTISENDFQQIISAYEKVVGGIEQKAIDDNDRAYGGIIRAGKGKLVESIAKEMVKLAWKDIGGNPGRLAIPIVNERIRIPIKKDYIEKIKNNQVNEYIKVNIDNYFYPIGTDVRVFIDRELVMIIECKSYTENAMLKRILVDFTLLKSIYPKLIPVLVQLESQLGGDYSSLKKVEYGSQSTHTLLSYFELDLNIITLLEGERKVDKPIHKKIFYKPLLKDNLLIAINKIGSLLNQFK